MIYALGDQRVVAMGDHFVADSAAVIGSVVLKNNTSVWFSAIVRGDFDTITIGENSNIQDCAIVHLDEGFPVSIGSCVTVGHKATLHGCTIGNNTLIGINAVVMNGAKIGSNCLIGSNALVTEGKEIPDGSLVLGSPGKVVREISEEEKMEITGFSDLYVNNFRRYMKELQAQLKVDGPRQ